MKYQLFFYLLLCVSFPLTAENHQTSEDPKVVSYLIGNIEKMERKGVKYHKKGKYEKAFKKLSKPASLGFKQSQYVIGIMYLKGQFLEQDIIKGLAWIGVANEVKIKEWQETFDLIYQNATKIQQMEIDKMMIEFTKKYGQKAQGMICNKTTRLRTRKPEIICNKNPIGVRDMHPVQ